MKRKIKRDTREQGGWFFKPFGDFSGTEVCTLKTGDYTVEGFEGVFCLERKGSVAEFAHNLVEPRFGRELERMRAFEVAVVMLEFDFAALTGWPASGELPASKAASVRTTAKFLLCRFWELQVGHPHVSFIFAGKDAFAASCSLFKRVVEKYG